jgi:uncharacterized membrane protein YciS (DUF1049 family)
MNDIINTITILLPVGMIVLYFIAVLVLIKIALYVFRLPKKLQELETRIKHLEEKERN